MELLIAILIYIGVLNASTPYTLDEVHRLEMKHKDRVEQIRKERGYHDPTLTKDKTVWDHEEL